MNISLSISLLLLVFTVEIKSSCDKNLIPDLSFKISGTNIAFPCPSTKNIYQLSGRHVPKHIIGTRLQVAGSDAVIALPRYKHGVPFTLGKISLKTKGCKATMQPFPCWAMQEEGNCQSLQSVVDIQADTMDTLWVLDVGIVNTLEQPVLRCPPKLVGINMRSGQMVKKIELTPFATPVSRLQYLLVDYLSDGRAFAFITDAGMGAILVYDVMEEKGFRVVLPPIVSEDTPAKDVLYVALLRKPEGNVVLFTYLSSSKLFSMNEEHLINGQAVGTVVEIGTKPKPVVILGTDNGASVLFRYKGESDIYIWNSDTTFDETNFILVQKGNDCRLSTQVVPGFRKLMWSIESNFHDYVADTTGVMGPSMVVHPLVGSME